MGGTSDITLGALAVKQGFCSQVQVDEALGVLKEVRSLGLEERLGSILIKKKYISAEQLKKILKLQGEKAKVHIAGYEIIEKLGQGGMGAVFKARQVSLDRIVALKILSPKLASDQQFVDRFLKEARAVAKLSHPNIIVGIDVGKFSKYCYFAMEYVEGDTALQILKKQGTFSEEKVLQLALQIAHALKHANQHRIVHRDIKPDNIMFSERNEAKLCDLGLAKRVGSDAAATQLGSAIGTPHYISPEQARGVMDVRITADFYGLGATLYHLVTGQTLFNGENSTATMTKHLLEEGPSAQKRRPELTDHFCDLLQKMLAKKPEDRQETPDELIEDIRAVMDARSITSRLRKGAKSSMAWTPKNTRAGRSQGRVQKSSGGHHSSGPRNPIDRPDAATNRHLPVKDNSMLLFAGAGLGFLVILGAAFFLMSGSNRSKAGSSKGKSLAERRTTRGKRIKRKEKGSASVVSNKEKKSAPSRPVANSTPIKAVPTIPLKWEALELARKAIKSEPEAYQKHLKLLEQALKGAPEKIQGAIYLERGEVLDKVAMAFAAILKTKVDEANALLKKGSVKAGLNHLEMFKIPSHLKTAKMEGELKEEQRKVVARVWNGFQKKEKLTLEKLFSQGGANVEALQRLQVKLEGIREQFAIKPAQVYVAAFEKKIRSQINLAKKNAQSAFYARIEAAQRLFRNGDGKKALIELNSSTITGSMGDTYKKIERDLKLVQGMLKQAGEVLGRMVGSPETVTTMASGIRFEGRVLSQIGKRGVIIASSTGQQKSVLFDKLDVDNIWRWSRKKLTADDQVRARALLYFWRGSLKKAYPTLKKAEAKLGAESGLNVYVNWMDDRALTLMARAEVLYRAALAGKKDKAALQKNHQEAKELVWRVERDFVTTEAYRAKTK